MFALSLKEKLLDAVTRFDIDLLGFGNVERFDTAEGNVVRRIMPSCKTVVCLGMRILRGSFRCIEEGSNYFQYHMAGVDTLEYKIMPERARRIASLIEDNGHEAMVQVREASIRQDDGYTYDVYYQDVWNNCTAENQMDFVRSAVLCGVGELGMHGHVLTESFGPFVRFCYILTDAEIEPDSVKVRSLCDECGKCRKECHTQYALKEKTKEENLGGVSYRVFDYDELICNVYYHGANRCKNPWMKPELMENLPDARAIKTGTKDLSREEALNVLDEMQYTFIPKHAVTNVAKANEDIGAGGGASQLRPVVSGQLHRTICGQACDRACFVHLEEEGKMKVKYVNPFRTRAPWSLDPDTY